ncbi:radical SAM protein [Geobacter sulfurreducens]|uniref:radical SAM protein n=1 Tax=Geobacter sulfurreducens TaxID=35554 RepID=UPI0020B7D784|nr:radical SAM protein [Geobacter sulfurreducens]UTG92339.1 radical SAM protein [Geobacter sulfurreducens]
MSAEIKPGFNYDRKRLADILPLPTPFTFLLAPSHICNLKCIYCSQGKKREELISEGFEFKLMDYEIFLKFAAQLKEFPNKLKLVFVSGMGEPLVHKRVPDMIAHMRDLDVAERLEIFTNGLLLTKDVADALAASGLTRLRVSLQGLNSKKYSEVGGADVNFDDLREKLAYFYSVRKQCKLYIKVIDSALEPGDEEKFYEMFRDVSDEMFIERFVPYQLTMGDYENEANASTTVYGDKVLDADVCPEPFFNWQIDLYGNIYPCCPLGLPKSFSVGNVNESTILEMWNGNKARELRLQLLRKERRNHEVCGRCQCFLSKLTPADRLDDDTERLIPLFEKAQGDHA